MEKEIKLKIKSNYGKIATQGGSGCCCNCNCGSEPADVETVAKRLGYSDEDVVDVPSEANLGLGCGNPLAFLALKEGQTVLDLGSGGGFDCFLARERVGETGLVIGVDMTPEMIQLARRNASQKGYSNVLFRLGEIEGLPVDDGTVDVIISNCVINLSQDKPRVFREAYRVLKPGGKLCISDVVAIRPISADVKDSLDLISGCIGGAAQVDELDRMLAAAGFVEIRMAPRDDSAELVSGWALRSATASYVASFNIQAQKH